MKFQSPLLGLTRLDKQTQASVINCKYPTQLPSSNTNGNGGHMEQERKKIGFTIITRADSVLWGNQTEHAKTKIKRDKL